MKVFVKCLTGDTYTLEGVQPDETIGDIKLRMSEIHEQPRFHAVDLRLIFAGKGLEDGRYTKEYNI